jgi:penicillin amidase
MMQLQNDNFHLLASEALPVMLDNLDTINLTNNQLKIYHELRDWDYFAGPNQISPSYFEVWWNQLYDYLWDEFDQKTPMVKPNDFMTIRILKEYPSDSAFDMANTATRESMTEVLHTSYLATLDSIDQWKDTHPDMEPVWYLFKSTSLMHYTNLKPFSITGIPVGGNKHIINANDHTHGASWRLIVEMGEQIEAYGIYAGGQSGNPGSPAYDTFVDDWAAGKYFKINFWESPDADRMGVRTYEFKQKSDPRNSTP